MGMCVFVSCVTQFLSKTYLYSCCQPQILPSFVCTCVQFCENIVHLSPSLRAHSSHALFRFANPTTLACFFFQVQCVWLGLRVRDVGWSSWSRFHDVQAFLISYTHKHDRWEIMKHEVVTFCVAFCVFFLRSCDGWFFSVVVAVQAVVFLVGDLGLGTCFFFNSIFILFCCSCCCWEYCTVVGFVRTSLA